jgi:peptidoglycan-N-acetylmuramic acid deacetylase
MKKRALLLILSMALAFSACAKNAPNIDNKNTSESLPVISDVPKDNTSTNTTGNTNNSTNTKDSNSNNNSSNSNPTNNNNILTGNKQQEQSNVPNTPVNVQTGKFVLPQVDISKLNTDEKGWYYQPKTDGTPSGEPQEILNLIKKYEAYYLGDVNSKVLYLTFDEGYENGYTPKILDILKKHNVKAAFFVVKPYITSNKDLVKRMVDEGHLVCNHSVNHPSMASIKDQNKFNEEFTGVEKSFEELTGKTMPKFFRPPMGKYSELSLYNTAALGYKSIFWSFAYDDWDPQKQPSHDYAKKLIMQRTHNGGIILLHAVSKTNTEILDEVLTEWKSKGFEFKTLNDLPSHQQ